MLEKINILGVGITNASMDKILEYITTGLEKSNKKYFIVTPNPEILTLANSDFSYKNILNKAEIALADGVGVIMASKVLGKPLKARVTGVDLLENLCSVVSEKPITVGFLGGRHRIAERTAECLRSRYPNLKIGFICQEWTKDGFVSLGRSSKFKIQNSSRSNRDKTQNYQREISPILNTKYLIHNTIDILFVAFGAPKQEKWIYENLEKLPVRVVIGVGGAFDYISGKVQRAPVWTQNIGFEWLYRLVRQPWRLKRQLSLLKFIWLVLKKN